MYAYNCEIGRGFFEGVRSPNGATAHPHDPPRPSIAKDSVPAPSWMISVAPYFESLLTHRRWDSRSTSRRDFVPPKAECEENIPKKPKIFESNSS